MDAVGVQRLQVKNPRMQGVGELVILKRYFRIPAQRDRDPILSYSLTKVLWLLQPLPAPGTFRGHLPAQLPGTSEAPLFPVKSVQTTR